MKTIVSILIIFYFFGCNTTATKEIPQSSTAENDTTTLPKKFDKYPVIDQVYCNAKFGYCINFDSTILFPQREADNGDGKIFKDKQGQTILTVYGNFNLDFNGEVLPLQKKYENELNEMNKNKGVTLSYKKLGQTFFVFSGIKNGKLFYEKTIAKEDVFATALLEYSTKEKVIYDQISEQIFNTFK